MKALLSKEPGPPSTLVVEDIEAPTAGKGEVLVRVQIAALNFFDCLIIEDKYQFKPPRPFSIAAEMSGIVEAVGEGVTRFKPGDRVCGYVQGGTAREMIVAPEVALSHIPDGVSDEQAACIMVTPCCCISSTNWRPSASAPGGGNCDTRGRGVERL